MNHTLPPLFDASGPEFQWQIPERFNIGTAISDDWAARDADRICLETFKLDGPHQHLTYGQLSDRSSALAGHLLRLGHQTGQRIAILLPQSFETAISHTAIYKMGGVALPLALLFGPDALSYRLKDAGASALITNRFGYEKLVAIRDQLADLQTIILTDGGVAGTESFSALTDPAAIRFEARDTRADDPALMIYTSGTTGPPKGALHAHRVLPGHIPGISMAHENMPQPGDKFWTPSDWAWAGGLLNCLLPGLLLGVPVVASPAQKFDPDMAFRLMTEMQVRNAFIPPTALRLMKSVKDPLKTYDLRLRTLGSAGESLGRETYEWAKATLGLTVNEFYGQTECNFVLSNSARTGITRSGSMGKPVPGHQVAILRPDGSEAAKGETGQVAIKAPDPAMFLQYWNNPSATETKFLNGWMLTGDQGTMDEDGYFFFFGRDDDVITSSGYRIGPGEVEDCLLSHPDVQLAAVIGKPDPVRTEIVKAFIVLKHDVVASADMAADIQDWVKSRLSMHEYPREIEFVADLPLTTTGKVIRRLLRDRG
ncbi:MAG: hypothetical protein RIR97_4 [Pseudomonadota bacterium]